MTTPKRALLIHRDNDNYRRLTGWWSYPVAEFQWAARKVIANDFRVDLTGAEREYDLVVLDDWIFGVIANRRLPLAYSTVDSARSPTQLKRNREQAAYADVVLVDSDRLDAFAGLGKPVMRFAYAVNEKLFYPREKQFDVAFLCWPTPERRIVQAQCADICKRHGWRFLTGTFERAEDYAAAIGSAKVVVHSAHIKAARSWRVFDVPASRGCLLSSPLPSVSGDGLQEGEHYHVYRDAAELEAQLCRLLENETWEHTAEAGYQHIMARHTWGIRAAEFRLNLAGLLGW